MLRETCRTSATSCFTRGNSRDRLRVRLERREVVEMAILPSIHQSWDQSARTGQRKRERRGVHEHDVNCKTCFISKDRRVNVIRNHSNDTEKGERGER
jgi:hypothetical protein